MSKRERRRNFSLAYYLTLAENFCSEFREFVLATAESSGRELIEKAPDNTNGRCGLSLIIRGTTRGYGSAKDLSDRIKGRYPDVTIVYSREYRQFRQDQRLA